MSLYGRGPASGPEVSDGLLAFVDGLVPLGSDLLLPQQDLSMSGGFSRELRGAQAKAQLTQSRTSLAEGDSMPRDSDSHGEAGGGARAGRERGLTARGHAVGATSSEEGGGESHGSDSSSNLMDRITRAMGDLLAPSAGKTSSTLGGSLVQLWLPSKLDAVAGDSEVLATRGAPFTVAAVQGGDGGDALAAFRYASTHYAFAQDGLTSAARGLPIGMPGRVFISGRAEVSPDVQLYAHSEYSRLPDAVTCGIHGTLAMPVFDRATGTPGSPSDKGSRRRRPVAVIELATPSGHVEWSSVIGRIAAVLESSGLSTCASARVDFAAASLQSQPALTRRSVAALTSLVQRAGAWPGISFAQAWRLCAPLPALPSRAGEGASSSPPPPPYLQTWGMPHTSVRGSSPSLAAFRVMCCETPLCAGQGLPGVALSRGCAEWTGAGDAFDISAYPLRHFAQAAGLQSGAALLLELPQNEGGCTLVLECLSPDRPATAAAAAGLLTSFQSLLSELATRAEASGLAPARVARKRGGREGGRHNLQVAPPAPAPAQEAGDEEDQVDDDDAPEESDEEEEAGEKGAQRSGAGLPIQKRTLSRDEMVDHFRFGLKEAALKLQMCSTTLKRICRTHGVARWPSRKKWRNELYPALTSPGGVDALMAIMAPGAAPQQGASKRRTSAGMQAHAQLHAAALAPSSASGGSGGGSGMGMGTGSLDGAGGGEEALHWGAGLPSTDTGSGHGRTGYANCPMLPAVLPVAMQALYGSGGVWVPPGGAATAATTESRSGSSSEGAAYLARVFAGAVHSAPVPWGPNGSPVASHPSAPEAPEGPAHAATSGPSSGGAQVNAAIAIPGQEAAATQARFCHSCGAGLRAAALFCHMCGTRV